MQELLATQRAAFLRDGVPSLAERKDRLRKLKAALQRHEVALIEAISADFGHRSAHETLIADLAPSIQAIGYTITHVGRWMRPRRRPVALHFFPARARVHPQPLGVIGIVAPWNYPLFLAIPPIASALAAGNRVMLKPSEFTPATNRCLAALLAEAFSEEMVAIVEGDADVGAAFTRLPFDHLFFTGSTSVGRHVMEAASANLVPVTLELGGKSPVLLDRGIDLARAARRVAIGKLFNAGQTCVAPDYALVPSEDVDAFVLALQEQVAALYPALAANRDYTAIINARQQGRLESLLIDAEAKGARLTVLDPGNEASSAGGTRKRLPVVLRDVDATMRVMQEEIFGPFLPVLPYHDLDEAIEFVRARPRPLALYLFSDDATTCARVLAGTHSGGVTINDTALHVLQEALPFGGVGASGMGAYHGEEGFRTFSHHRAVFQQSRWNIASLVRPPYGRLAERLLRVLLR